jgi:hypothetical protein
MKRTPITRLSNPKNKSPATVESWHNGGDIEILQYARSLQAAAKTLVLKLGLERTAKTAWDVCPVVVLYRQALEIHPKMLVGEGSRFLASPTDPIFISTTHSLVWLAQIVCQIIKAVGWEGEFKCNGVSSLAEFSALIDEVETFDPVIRAIHSSKDPNSVSQYYRNFGVVKFVAKLDGPVESVDRDRRCADGYVGPSRRWHGRS